MYLFMSSFAFPCLVALATDRNDSHLKFISGKYPKTRKHVRIQVLMYVLMSVLIYAFLMYLLFIIIFS